MPGGSNANNYANVQLIVDLCISENVDAVMVGSAGATPQRTRSSGLGDLLTSKSAELGRDVRTQQRRSGDQCARILSTNKLATTAKLQHKCLGASCRGFFVYGLYASPVSDLSKGSYGNQNRACEMPPRLSSACTSHGRVRHGTALLNRLRHGRAPSPSLRQGATRIA